jgi:hypothetical protein
MSEYHVEKRREAAKLTLTSGSTMAGSFFLSGSSPAHVGHERVGDLLNFEDGFFPFETEAGTELINRAHVLKVVLPPPLIEVQFDAGYDVSVRRRVSLLLTNGERVSGVVAVMRPRGHDRLSDFTRSDERFHYLELPEQTLLINSAHIVAMSEVPE